MSNLVVRSISGLFIAVVMIGAIMWCDLSKFILFALVAILSAKEIFTMINSGNKVKLFRQGALTIAILSIIMLVYHLYNQLFVPVTITMVLLRLIIELYRKDDGSIFAATTEMAVGLYLLIPTLLIFSMEWDTLLFILFMVWCNDVGAYFVGITIGKNRLFERVSPKKSWEGFFGGLIFTLLFAFAANHFYFTDASPILYIVIGCVVSVAAVFGDLFESLVKREFKIKDSGSLIPGHGGVWDRFDALFFAVPAYYIVESIFNL